MQAPVVLVLATTSPSDDEFAHRTCNIEVLLFSPFPFYFLLSHAHLSARLSNFFLSVLFLHLYRGPPNETLSIRETRYRTELSPTLGRRGTFTFAVSWTTGTFKKRLRPSCFASRSRAGPASSSPACWVTLYPVTSSTLFFSFLPFHPLLCLDLPSLCNHSSVQVESPNRFSTTTTISPSFKAVIPQSPAAALPLFKAPQFSAQQH